jgi:hypothetical protein
MKSKHKIINSDSGLIIEKNYLECKKIIEDIEKQIIGKNLAKILQKTLDENVALFKSTTFDPFRKSFKLKTKYWVLAIEILNVTDYKFIMINEIKEVDLFSQINFKFGPSLLIIYFGNLIFFAFIFFRKKIMKLF